MKRIAVLVLLISSLFGCGAYQLRQVSIDMHRIASSAETHRLVIESACAVLDSASDHKVDLCAAAVETYEELALTLRSLADAVRAAEDSEDPNMLNVEELNIRAIRLEYKLVLIIQELVSAL